MGQFEKNVRRNKIAGPNQRGFRRLEWESLLHDSSLDNDDQRLLRAGLFFDQLLSFLRTEKKVSELPITPQAIIRFVIAIATFNLYRISQEAKISSSGGDGPPTMVVSAVMEKTVQLPTGQHFSPDELITGTGDGMKHMLRELLSAKSEPAKLTEHEADSLVVDAVNLEFNKAILYQCAVEYWNDCVGNGYGLMKHPKGIALVPFDRPLEIARTVSVYRRLNITLQDTMLFVEMWLHKWPRKRKEKMCEIPLVIRVAGQERIERIELGLNAKSLSAASSTVAAKLWLQHSYYKHLLYEPLPKYFGFTLNQIIVGWQLLQSLAEVIFDSLRPIEPGNVKRLLTFAPKIAKRTLIGTFAKGLSLDHLRAEQLIDVFVFDPASSQEVWTQPLISYDDDLCLAIPCIHSVHLQRIVEGWMRQGGLDLDRRGPEFETFCREDLVSSLKNSPIKQSVQILNNSIRFKPPTERGEEIDIVIIIGSTILLIEAKCILWPDDSLQFANYRDTVEGAVEQIIRKKNTVARNYKSFSERLRTYP